MHKSIYKRVFLVICMGCKRVRIMYVLFAYVLRDAS